ncbi:T9SS type A sorting domain-containing protein [Lutibacter sp.]|uniref:T9SS type A sorting domain-containing protein n=1 Tax=Lutibacter sp. TaxID=1925666 RepID=UPI00345DC7DF
MYPNPVSTNLYIQLTSELKFISVNIFDYLGENVLKSKKTMLDVSTLSKGVYFLKVETNKGIGIKKVIIN